MIIDRLEYADRYVALHPQFGAAFRYLRNFDVTTMTPGRQTLEGAEIESPDEPFVIIEQTTGRGTEAAKIEHHRRYIDIQYVAEGTETIGYLTTGHCNQPSGPFDADRDIGFYEDRPATWVEIPAGCFAVFFSEDGHAPLAGRSPVTKVVIKIPQSPEQILSDLRDELQIAGELNPEQAERIELAIADFQQALRGNQTSTGSLAEQFRQLAQELEVSHPRLTHTVGRVADALAQIGI